MGKLVVEIPPSAPAGAAKLFGIDETSLVAVQLAQNHTYSAVRDGVKIILRITPEEHLLLSSMNAQIDFVNYLRNVGVHVCEPLLSPTGKYLETMVAESGQKLFVSAWRHANGLPLHDPHIHNPLSQHCFQEPSLDQILFG